MIVIPAIDILDGRCVRLVQGDYDKVTVYDDDVVRVAMRYEAAGATRLHLVDLNAARAPAERGARRGSRSNSDAPPDGKTNRAVIARVREAVSCVIEVGGGVRSDDDVAELVSAGVDRIVVGTALARDPEMVAAWVRTHGARFIAGIDARDGLVRISGWETGTSITDESLARTARDIGMVSIVYTSISRDGMLSGPDIAATRRVAEAARIPVILSGGIGSDEDVDAVAVGGGTDIRGVILGKAVYEGRVDLPGLLSRYAVTNDEGEW